MKVAIHQPNYLPWIGYFSKMAQADVFIIFDTAQFSRDSYTQRTKIRTKDGWTWLTIPISKQFHFQPIQNIAIPGLDWRKKHINSIQANYAKSPHYDETFIKEYFESPFPTLSQFNEHGIQYFKDKFDIRTKIIRASELPITESTSSTDLLIKMIKYVGGDVYISGTGGKKYQDETQFGRENITIQYNEFKPESYKQRWGGFEPFMSVIDLYFNLGQEGSIEFISSSKNGFG
jgi:hypothetical protein